MAQVVLGFGSSHGPAFNPLEAWFNQDQRDQRDVRFDYAELLRNAPPGLEAEVAREKMQARHEAVTAAAGTLGEVVKDAAPDAIVVLSNPHGNATYEQMQPVFGIFLSAASGGPRALPRPRFTGEAQASEGDQFPINGELADHLMGSLIDAGIDVACAFQPRPGTGLVLDHAYAILYQRYVKDRSVPMVPFAISRDAPNLATASRCYALGRALREAIEGWDQDKRVAIMASGGLSHQIMDEELDRAVLSALQAKDVNGLCSLPRDRLNRGGGTPEILNWVALAGAMEAEPMELIDYVPCYRSLAGTGHGVAIAYWR